MYNMMVINLKYNYKLLDKNSRTKMTSSELESYAYFAG